MLGESPLRATLFSFAVEALSPGGHFKLRSGVDFDQVLPYISAADEQDEDATSAAESQLESADSKFLPCFYNTLLSSGLPSDLIDCW
jgi:hypothetical protein